MACGKNCGDNCGCCFENGVATTTHQVGDCTVFDVVISSDACNTVSLGSDGGLLVKECAGVFEDSLCDDATDPPTPFVRTTVIACDGTRTIVDTTPDGDPYVVVGNVVCCGSGGGAVPDVVTTLIENAVAKTATYTNEIGATTVLSETDFTANSQVVPATCEGVLADADIKRELPVRWDTASNTYKAYDDGNDASVIGNNGACFPAPPIGTPTAPFTTTINNPSACKSLNVFYQYVFAPDVFTGANNLMKAHVEMSINGGPFNLHYIAYHPGLNPGGIRGYGSPHIKEATTFIVPPGGTLTLDIRGIILYDTGAVGSIFYNYCLAASFIGVTA
jgi:hypothetical protein